jgi:outer membrane biosynthesis protein TonB
MSEVAQALREPFAERLTEDLGARVAMPPAPSRFRWWIPLVLAIAAGVVGGAIWRMRDRSEPVHKTDEPAVAPVKLEAQPPPAPAARVELPAPPPSVQPPVERKPTKRTKPAKRKTTRQGETLD